MTQKRFWPNLNVFIAFVFLGLLIVKQPSGMLLMPLFMALEAMTGSTKMAYLSTSFGSLLIFAAIPAYFWIKRGLIPAAIAPERMRRYRIGHALTAAGTIAILLMLLMSLLMLHALVNPVQVFIWYGALAIACPL